MQPQVTTIGRAPDNTLVITPQFPGWETVSKRHARIYRHAGHWILQDLDSTNGSYVNARRTGHNLLRNGWEVHLGGVPFVFRADTGEASG